MLAPDGSLNENGAPFTGLMRYDARIAIEEALKEKVRMGFVTYLIKYIVRATATHFRCFAYLRGFSRARSPTR